MNSPKRRRGDAPDPDGENPKPEPLRVWVILHGDTDPSDSKQHEQHTVTKARCPSA